MSAIVVAAGRGERAGGAVPKQLAIVGGRTILQRSVDAFANHAAVTEIVVVLPDSMVAEGPSLVTTRGTPCRFVAGGSRRQDSVRLGFAAVSPSAEIVLVHDAARPFVSADVIDRVIQAARSAGAAVPGVPARDTLKRAEPDRLGWLVAETIRRDGVWLAQTPQGFNRAVIADAVARGEQGPDVTDEAMLVESMGRPVEIVMGDERNVKITTPEDLAAARRAAGAAVRVGTGYDLHRLVPGRRLVLAGVEIAPNVGPDSHSDGDVVCHALIDALLGAAAAGDIGRHFPNTDPAWKDAPGLDLLARTAAILRQRGFQTANVDITVVLERPKLGPHAAAIADAIGRVLELATDDVSVKAKTNEGVDAVGRGEAIAAHAVAMIRQRESA